MAAQITGLGKTTVPAAGTPVPVAIPSSVAGPATPGENSVHAILIQALAGNSGKVYVGGPGLNKSTLANCFVVLPVPTSNLIPTFSISVTAAANALSLQDLYIDVDVNGEGVLVSVVVV